MKLKEYLDNASFFPFLDVSQLKEKGEYLDKYLKIMYGERTCGLLITTLLSADGTMSESNQRFIADIVYNFYKNKWDMLIKYSEEEMNPLIESSKTVTETFGKTVGNQLSGSDSYDLTDKISGFDSTNFVDSNNSNKETTYGKKSDKVYGGSDSKTTESRDSQSEKLLSYALKFWNDTGLTRTITHDAMVQLCIPIYTLDENKEDLYES